uniref:Molecular chaperone DnaK (HSP70) n=1 Tax=Candidatus Kentrum sp. MB TaxID=2138164 RepID=A0A450XVW2_9GAMM|nr:MAG: Molecular chaperone DnaK (HSP70) [Candidatus Kentron sp. MB]VFK33412.1 MAG: Molecular chaperone DnaK (HSP70) [Candidatus Kentron sp. MB]VFK76154.1 MAG: Molecular chaperone DnaK (HSP70) [Candidatus Kentron sp. MB]
MKRVYGIDLGTTYSCIAWVDEHGKPVVIPNAEGEITTPSAVYFETADNIVVGQHAKDVAKVHEDRVVQTVKRVMGDPGWELEYFEHVYKPQEISALILRKLVGDAQAERGETIEDVVITCPAYFGATEKEATRQAGIIAGLNVLYVIPEPTAAAIAYGLALDQDQVVLVFDLGGGTFDVTVIKVSGGGIEVMATGGEKELGGKDWDDAIVTYFAQEFENQTGESVETLRSDLETYQELLLDAERCKRTLSNREKHTQRVRYGGESAAIELTREKFDEITASLLERTFSLTNEVLGRAREYGSENIDVVLLVGGSTYMPQIHDRVSREFSCEIKRIDPNQIVAKGAALFGYRCQLDQEIRIRVAEKTGVDAETVEIDDTPAEIHDEAVREVADAHGMALPNLKRLVDTEITNVTSKSFGLVVIGEDGTKGVTNMVLVDDKVPKLIARPFSTYEEGQNGVSIEVYENHDRQGEEVLLDLEQCTLLGAVELTFLRPLPKKSPLEVTFELTPDGLLKLHGRDLTTNQEIELEFKTESIMSSQEVDEARGKNLAMKVS